MQQQIRIYTQPPCYLRNISTKDEGRYFDNYVSVILWKLNMADLEEEVACVKMETASISFTNSRL